MLGIPTAKQWINNKIKGLKMKKTAFYKPKLVALAACAFFTACALDVTPTLWQTKKVLTGRSTYVKSAGYDSAGNLYQLYYFDDNGSPGVGKTFLRKVSSTGDELWVKELDSSSPSNYYSAVYQSLAVCDEGVALSAEHQRKVEMLDANGNSRWLHDYSDELPPAKELTQGPAVAQVVADSACNVAVSFRYGRESTGSTIRLDRYTPQGTIAWTQSLNLDFTASAWSKPVLDLLPDDGLVIIYGSQADSHHFHHFDGAGNVVAEGSLNDRYGGIVFADHERIVTLAYSDAQERMESFDLSGALQWSHPLDSSIAGSPSALCSLPVGSNFYCLGNKSPYDSTLRLIKFNVGGAEPEYFSTSFAGEVTSVSSMPDGNLLVLEHPPISMTLAKVTPQTYYTRFNVINGDGKKLDAVVMNSGKQRAIYTPGTGYWLANAAPGDIVQAFKPYKNQLLVAGRFGLLGHELEIPYEDLGIPEAEAYNLKNTQ